MKTYVLLWLYLPGFFLKWDLFETKVVEKIKTHILCLITFFRKLWLLWNNVEKYVRARQAKDDNIIRRMRYARWITKATDTHSEYVILFAFLRLQCIRESASVLRYTCIACLVLIRMRRDDTKVIIPHSPIVPINTKSIHYKRHETITPRKEPRVQWIRAVWKVLEMPLPGFEPRPLLPLAIRNTDQDFSEPESGESTRSIFLA